jgi:putative endonuclease
VKALPPDRPRLGRFGEQVAAEFLERRGAVVLGRNVEIGGGEIDLVVAFGHRRAVVEVRTARRSDVTADLFSRAKERQVRRLAALMEPPVFRIDFVTVLIQRHGVTVRWDRRV